MVKALYIIYQKGSSEHLGPKHPEYYLFIRGSVFSGFREDDYNGRFYRTLYNYHKRNDAPNLKELRRAGDVKIAGEVEIDNAQIELLRNIIHGKKAEIKREGKFSGKTEDVPGILCIREEEKKPGLLEKILFWKR